MHMRLIPFAVAVLLAVSSACAAADTPIEAQDCPELARTHSSLLAEFAAPGFDHRPTDEKVEAVTDLDLSEDRIAQLGGCIGEPSLAPLRP